MNRKKISILTVLVILLVASVNLVYAGNWTSPTLTGTWGTLDPEIGFNGSGDNTGQLTTYWDSDSGVAGTQAVENCSGFWLNMTVLDLGADPVDIWDWETKEIIVSLNLLSAWGLTGSYQQNVTLFSKKSVDEDTNQTQLITGTHRIDIKTFPAQFQIYLSKVDATHMDVDVAYFDHGGTTTFPNGTVMEGFYVHMNYTQEVNSEFFENDMVIALSVSHVGNGHFRFFALGEAYQNGATPNKIEGFDASKAVTDWTKGVTDWFNDVKDFLVGGFSFIVGIVKLLLSFAIAITPYLPFIALLYLIDLVITSFQKGSLQPIGYAFSKAWEMIVQAYDTIVHFGELIWDAITFWT